MTYIELFDNISIENICACLTNPPERVVFVGGSMKKMMAYGAFYEQMFAKIDIKVEMVYKSVNVDSLFRFLFIRS